MKVSEIMTKATVTDAAQDSLAEAAARMWNAQTGSLLVMEGENLLGILTERDVLRAIAHGMDPQQVPVKDLMRTDVITVGPQTSLKEAAKLMATKWIRHLPVVEGSRVVGILSQRDLTGVLAEALHEPEALHQLVEASALIRERRLKRIEAGDLD
ncbi:MAG TPA: CBS domain-containing protein [Actinomycetota bacterium]|jgi:CBS domain-containing protein|nr:CBS domain-containing protein [Actinomycetota bacterium]